MTNASIDQKLATLMDVTIEDESAQLLYDMVAPPDGEKECIAVRLLLGNGHSGFGLYVASADYPEEGAMLLAPVAAHAVAQAQPVAWSGDPSVQDYASTQSPPLEKPRAVELPEPDTAESKPLPGADWTVTMRRMMNCGCSKCKCTCKAGDEKNCIWWDDPGDSPRGAATVHQLLAAERQKSQDVLTLAQEALKKVLGYTENWPASFTSHDCWKRDAASAKAAIAAIDKLIPTTLPEGAKPLLDKEGETVGLHWDRALSAQEVKAVSDFNIRESKDQP